MKTERGIVRLPSHRAPSILPLWLALVAAAVLAPSPAGARAQGPPAQPVIVDRVRLEEVQERRLVTGEIRAVRRSRVAAEEGGIVIELPVREGERVERGDLLARLDGSRLALELKILEGEKEAAAAIRDERQADVEQKRRDLESLRALSERGATNPKELADAESAWKIAGARRAQADEQVRVIEARAALLGDRIADTEIRAPFDGAVVARHTELGEWLAEGDPVVEILSTGKVEAWLAVPQKHLGAVLAERHPIPLQIEATGASPQADSIRVIPLVDPRARTFALVATLENPDGRLAPGMSVTGWVPAGGRSRELTVSKDALLRNAAGPYIFLARGGSPGAPAKAVPLPVQALFSVAGRIVVRAAGLEEGDLAIAEGNERLFPMMPVMPSPRGATGEAGEADDREPGGDR